MIEDMLLIDYDPFARDSRIIVVQNEQRSMLTACSDLPELTQALIGYTEQFNLYNVRMHAPLNTFYEFKRQLEQAEKDVYSENKITLEIC